MSSDKKTKKSKSSNIDEIIAAFQETKERIAVLSKSDDPKDQLACSGLINSTVFFKKGSDQLRRVNDMDNKTLAKRQKELEKARKAKKEAKKQATEKRNKPTSSDSDATDSDSDSDKEKEEKKVKEKPKKVASVKKPEKDKKKEKHTTDKKVVVDKKPSSEKKRKADEHPTSDSSSPKKQKKTTEPESKPKPKPSPTSVSPISPAPSSNKLFVITEIQSELTKEQLDVLRPIGLTSNPNSSVKAAVLAQFVGRDQKLGLMYCKGSGSKNTTLETSETVYVDSGEYGKKDDKQRLCFAYQSEPTIVYYFSESSKEWKEIMIGVKGYSPLACDMSTLAFIKPGPIFLYPVSSGGRYKNITAVTYDYLRREVKRTVDFFVCIERKDESLWFFEMSSRIEPIYAAVKSPKDKKSPVATTTTTTTTTTKNNSTSPKQPRPGHAKDCPESCGNNNNKGECEQQKEQKLQIAMLQKIADDQTKLVEDNAKSTQALTKIIKSVLPTADADDDNPPVDIGFSK